MLIGFSVDFIHALHTHTHTHYIYLFTHQHLLEYNDIEASRSYIYISNFGVQIRIQRIYLSDEKLQSKCDLYHAYERYHIVSHIETEPNLIRKEMSCATKFRTGIVVCWRLWSGLYRRANMIHNILFNGAFVKRLDRPIILQQ